MKKQYEEYIHRTFVEANPKIKINGIVTIKKNNPVTMSLSFGNIAITIDGPTCETALNRAVSREDVDKQLRKWDRLCLNLIPLISGWKITFLFLLKALMNSGEPP